MTIYDRCGKPYVASGSLQMFDDQNPDSFFWRDILAENYKIWGSPILYFELLIQAENVDQLYLEDRSKLFSPNGITLYTIYEPTGSTLSSGQFGIDSGTQETLFSFSYHDVITRLGHVPKIGSRLFSPHRRENWMIVNRQAADFKQWQLYEMQLLCTKFQESLTDSTSQQSTSARTTTNYNIE